MKTYSLSGFNDEGQKLKQYQTCLEQYGYKFMENFTQEVNVLVVNSTSTEKFKLAQLHKNPIPCVSKKWIQQTLSKRSLQPIKQYLISERQIFYGVMVAICGFNQQITESISKIIIQKKGNIITNHKAADIIRNYENIFENQIPPDVILASANEVERAKHVRLPTDASDFLPPLVKMQWLEDSLKQRRCKYPFDYALNIHVQFKPLVYYLKSLQKKLDNLVQANDIMEKSNDILTDCVFYLDKEMNIDTLRVFRNLIAISGGYWSEKFSQFVTHVLIVDIDQNKFNRFKNYGTNKVHVLRPQWLIDSIKVAKKLSEQDYFIRSFKITQQRIKIIYQQQAMRNMNYSLNFQNNPMNRLDKRISNDTHSNNISTLEKKDSDTKKTKVTKSTVFNQRMFFIHSNLMKDQFYIDLNKKIRNAGGITYDKVNANIFVIVPLRDHPENIKMASFLFKNKYKFVMVSARWVDYCLKQDYYIDPDLNTYIQFRAFDFFVPLPEFHKFVFEIAGFLDIVKAQRLKQILPVLGSTKCNPNKAQITHVLCGPDMQSNEAKLKIQKIYKQNKKFKLIDSEWVNQCLAQKKVVDFKDFELSYQQSFPKCPSPNTPEKETGTEKQKENSTDQHKTSSSSKSNNNILVNV